MNTAKKLGIFMDHSIAHMMELETDPIQINSIESRDTEAKNFQETSQDLHQQLIFYRKLGEIIKNYEEVILFGPSDTKVELYIVLKVDYLFSNIKIAVIQTEKMSENQQYEFVIDHFLKNEHLQNLDSISQSK